MNKNKFLPYNIKLKERARELRKNQTAAERKIWNYYLKKHKYKFTRQKPINNFVVDFYCSELGLVVEIDGATHLNKKEVRYDNLRSNILKGKYGLKILRYWNDDVISGVHIVSELIDAEIERITHPTPPLSGRE